VTIFLPEPHLLDSPRGREWPHYPAFGAGAPAGPPPRAANVVIVGAGLAGLAIASALWHLDVRDVVLLDRDGRPARRFFDRVDMLDQRVLRSPYGHHPGVEGYRDCELMDFARLHWGLLTPVERREIRMAQAGHRSVVPIDVFEAYCRHVSTIHHVTANTWRSTVRAVRPETETLTVYTDTGAVSTRYVVLCVGEERRSAPTMWWPDDRPPPKVSYWDEPVPAGIESLVVVGAGLTAAHLLANAVNAGQRVEWVLRQPEERYQCSDVNASFFRAEGRARFDGVAWSDRLALMGRERRATVMFEFQPLLRAAEASGQLTVHRGRPVTSVGASTVSLSDGRQVRGDHVVLALGTTMASGEHLLPAKLVGARDGWADLDESTLAYRGEPRVFAVGATAGMVLGPAARNIDGHRVATARVSTTIATRLAAGASALPDFERSDALV
jgi:NADPH-dependent 2,4-dienoyl-CoA reductase/sulfur reductase-like enzyme